METNELTDLQEKLIEIFPFLASLPNEEYLAAVHRMAIAYSMMIEEETV